MSAPSTHSENQPADPVELPVPADFLMVSGLENIMEKAATGEISTKALHKALADTHKKILEQRQVILNLKGKVADLALTQKRSDQDKAATALNDEIAKIGRFYQLFYSPFDATSFYRGMTAPSFAHNSDERYDVVTADDPDERNLGEIADLFHCIPQKFHTYMAMGDGFKKTFNSALGENRSQCLTRLRAEAYKIFDIKTLSSLMSASKAKKSKSKSKAAAAASESLRKSSLPAVQDLLRDKKGNLDHTSRFPAVLYPSHSEFNVSDLFTNPSLFKIARTVLYGPTHGEDEGGASFRRNSPYVVRQERGMATTEGLIAWTCVMARFLLSDDTEFTSMGSGAESGFSYKDDFELYKKIIIEARKKNPQWYENLMKKWNFELFSAKKHATYDGDEHDKEEFPKENQFNDIMAQICGDQDENTEEGRVEAAPDPNALRAARKVIQNVDSESEESDRVNGPWLAGTLNRDKSPVPSMPRDTATVAALNIGGLSITNEAPIPTQGEPAEAGSRAKPTSKAKARPQPKPIRKAVIAEAQNEGEPHGENEAEAETGEVRRSGRKATTKGRGKNRA